MENTQTEEAVETAKEGDMLPEVAAGLAEVLEERGEPGIETSSEDKGEESVQEAAEEPVEEKAGDQPTDDKEVHRRFAEMSRKEREIRRLAKEAEQLQEQRKQWEEEKSKLSSKLSEYDSLFREARTNPDAVLSKAGLSYDYLTERILNDGKPTAEHQVGALQQEIQQLRQAQQEWQETYRKQQEELAQADYQRQVQTFVQDVGNFIEKSDSYELTRHFGEPGVQQVIDTMAKVYQDSDKSLSNDEAAQLVEEAYEKDIEALLEVPKVRSLIEGKFGISLNGKVSESKTATSGEKKNSGGKTLTNDMARTPAVPEADTDSLSEEELIKRAASHLRWT